MYKKGVCSKGLKQPESLEKESRGIEFQLA